MILITAQNQIPEGLAVQRPQQRPSSLISSQAWGVLSEPCLGDPGEIFDTVLEALGDAVGELSDEEFQLADEMLKN